jgi:hypothetical protein
MLQRVRPVLILLTLLGPVAVFALPLDLEPAARRALAIAVWMVLAWLVDVLHPAIVGFAGCFLFVVSRAAEFDVAFGGFGTATPWFLYGALMLLVAAQSSGAVWRFAAWIPSGVTTSFLVAAATVAAVAFVTSVTVDSAAARAVIAVIVALAVSLRFDAVTRVDSRLPLVAVASYTAAVLGAESVGSIPSLAWRLIAVIVCIGIAALFVRPASDVPGLVHVPPGETSGRVMLLIAFAMAAWMTTPLHGVSAGIIGLAAGLATALPGMKRPAEDEPQADPLALILAGAALSMPLVLAETKADAAFASAPPMAAALLDPRIDAPVKFALYQSPALILGAAVSGFAARHVLIFAIPLALITLLTGLI